MYAGGAAFLPAPRKSPIHLAVHPCKHCDPTMQFPSLPTSPGLEIVVGLPITGRKFLSIATTV